MSNVFLDQLVEARELILEATDKRFDENKIIKLPAVMVH